VVASCKKIEEMATSTSAGSFSSVQSLFLKQERRSSSTPQHLLQRRHCLGGTDAEAGKAATTDMDTSPELGGQPGVLDQQLHRILPQLAVVDVVDSSRKTTALLSGPPAADHLLKT
jgi:hypothetical protein